MDGQNIPSATPRLCSGRRICNPTIRLNVVIVLDLATCVRAAENLAIPFRLPFEVILRDMQTSLKQEGYWTVAARIWKTQGILGFYKGWLSPMFMGFRSGIQQSIFDQLKQARLAQLRGGGLVLTELSFATAFIFGSIGRFFVCLWPSPSARYVFVVSVCFETCSIYTSAALRQHWRLFHFFVRRLWPCLMTQIAQRRAKV